LDGLTNTVQQKLNEAAQRVLNTNAPPAEQKPEGTAEETPDKNMPPAGQKPDASSQGVLDKYTRSAEQKPKLTISKEKLFESWKREYLLEGKPITGNFDRTSKEPSFFSGRSEVLSDVLYNDYGVHCGRSPADNLTISLHLTEAIQNIVLVQYNEQDDSARARVTESVKWATTGNCSKYTSQITLFLDEFVTESEKWYQQNIEYIQRKNANDAQLARQKAEQEEAARQQKAEQKAAEHQVEIDKQRAEQQRIAERAAALRSGQVKIESFGDAKLFYSPAAGQLLIMRPMVQPDGKLYEAFGVLERVEGNTLIAKISDTYFFITTEAKQPHEW
jgi:hypothetical protein